MDLAQRVRRAILIVAEKYTRIGRLAQCAVAKFGSVLQIAGGHVFLTALEIQEYRGLDRRR